MIASWYIDSAAGLILSALCASFWIVIFYCLKEPFTEPSVLYWNAFTEIGFFIVVVELFASLRKSIEHERQLALTDPLTGLLNRRAFYKALELELLRAARYRHGLALCHIDPDNFKRINDQFGHNTGDKLLQQVASNIKRFIRSSDIVSRLGGDEFAIILVETGESMAEAVIAKLHQHLNAEMQSGGLYVTFSCGLVVCRNPEQSAENLINIADHKIPAVGRNGKLHY